MVPTLNEILAPAEKQELGVVDTPFFPEIPTNLQQTGLNQILIEDLICKTILSHGSLTGSEIAASIGLPLRIISDLLYDLKQRLILAYQGTVGVSDFEYILSENGRQKALLAREQSNYIGTAPVNFEEYLESLEKQSISNEQPGLEQLKNAFEGLVLPQKFFDRIGPAVNSRRGLFLYGNPGNGKTEIAIRISKCFTDSVYIPRTIIVEGQLIQLYDPQCHKIVQPGDEHIQLDADARWIKIERPAVVVGGEMDMESLEIGYNSQTKICEASLQMKGNSGIFVLDDFGRQRVGPETLLNRWVLPLEKQIDYLTLPSGSKIQVPFNALLVFCSNLDPGKLLDEAFLRRIPYKLEMNDPSKDDFIEIFKDAAAQYNIPYKKESIDYLMEKHFNGVRSLRGCHPRDIMQQLVNIATYENRKPAMTKTDLNRSIELYFSATHTIEKFD